MPDKNHLFDADLLPYRFQIGDEKKVDRRDVHPSQLRLSRGIVPSGPPVSTRNQTVVSGHTMEPRSLLSLTE